MEQTEKEALIAGDWRALRLFSKRRGGDPSRKRD
jgi:hypothetical protein